MTTIDLLRHGEAAPGQCLGADYDAPLTEAGWTQMGAAAAGAAARWDGIASSPSRRCAEFADALARQRGLPLHGDERFRELGFGAWEGRSWGELYLDAGDALLRFQRDPASGPNPAPGGEAYAAFERRVADAWVDLTDLAAGGHWLLVAHAGVVRAVLRSVLGFPPERLFDVHVPYACLSRIEQTAGQLPRLTFHGSLPPPR